MSASFAQVKNEAFPRKLMRLNSDNGQSVFLDECSFRAMSIPSWEFLDAHP